MRTAQRFRWLSQLLLGSCLGSLGLWLAFRGLVFSDILAGFRGIDWSLTAAALFTTLAALAISTLRWQVLFYPDHHNRSFGVLFRGTVIGQMLNIVMPLRVGEVARIYAVADDRTSKTRVLATLAVEKVLDLAGFALAVIIVLALVALPADVQLQQRTLWVGALGGTVLFWWLAGQPRVVKNLVGVAARLLPAAWRSRAVSAGEAFLEGFSALRSSSAGFTAALLTLLLVAAGALTNYLLFRAFGLTLPPVAALLLLVLLQVGAVPPSLPGKLGIFNYLTVVGLAVFGVDRGRAFSYSILLYVVAFAPKIMLGAAYLALGRHSQPLIGADAASLANGVPRGGS
jgi:uncharacterized protein (TIRG00374 family)